MEKRLESSGPEETRALARSLAQKARPGDIYCLSGDLGVGKTVFAQGFAEGLGVRDYVASPTFAIVNEYPEAAPPFYHFDVYRLSCVEEMEDTGYEQYFFGDGVCLVEWAERIEELIPPEAVWILLEKDLSRGTDYRAVTIRASGGEKTP